MTYPALTYLLVHAPERLFPEETKELLILLGRVQRMEQVEADAQNLIDAVEAQKTYWDSDELDPCPR